MKGYGRGYVGEISGVIQSVILAHKTGAPVPKIFFIKINITFL